MGKYKDRNSAVFTNDKKEKVFIEVCKLHGYNGLW